MALVFHGEPFEKGEDSVVLYLNGHDEVAKCDVQCCVVCKVLRVCCDAEGIKPEELKRAFEAHRERIEAAAIQKYEAGDVKRLPDWVVVRLEVADLCPGGTTR